MGQETERELTPGQEAAVEWLQKALSEFAGALGACNEVGLEPADAFRAAGIEVPLFAASLLNSALSPVITAR